MEIFLLSPQNDRHDKIIYKRFIMSNTLDEVVLYALETKQSYKDFMYGVREYLIKNRIKSLFCIPLKENADCKFSKTLSSLTSTYDEYIQTNWMLLLKIFDDDIMFNNFNENLTFSLINTESNKKLAEKAFKEIQELTNRITKTIYNTL